MDHLLISSGTCSSKDWEGFNDLEFPFLLCYWANYRANEIYTKWKISASPAVLWVLGKNLLIAFLFLQLDIVLFLNNIFVCKI